jgi:hypothetical protein
MGTKQPENTSQAHAKLPDLDAEANFNRVVAQAKANARDRRRRAEIAQPSLRNELRECNSDAEQIAVIERELQKEIDLSNADSAMLEEALADLESVLRPKPKFHEWLDRWLEDLDVSTYQLACAYSRLQGLRPVTAAGTFDTRWGARIIGASATPAKKEMAKYRAGKKEPSPAVAYRIGRAIEELLYCAEPETLLTVYPPGICGLDAVVAAGSWRDAIGCLGVFVGKGETISIIEKAALKEILIGALRGRPLPVSMRSRLDRAWLQWNHDRDPNRLPPRFAAAYHLASIGNERADEEAVAILHHWIPRRLT